MKIESKLLNLMYPTVSTDLLMDIITATPNPTVATELLCGLYQAPVIQEQPCERFKANRKSETDFKAVGYNKWNDEVFYSYKEVPSKIVWCLKSEPVVEYKNINPIYCEYYPKDVIIKAKLDMSEDTFKTLYDRKNVYGEPVDRERTSGAKLENWQESAHPLTA